MGQLFEILDVAKAVKALEIETIVETGSGIGDTVEHIVALDLPVKIYTIELMQELHDRVARKFLDDIRVIPLLGYSHEEINWVLPFMSEGPAIFWHDAHFPGADFGIEGKDYTSEPDPTIRLPLEWELRQIVQDRDVSNDLFVIDDLRVYKDGPYEDGNWGLRSVAGGDGYDFVIDMLSRTHYLHESYLKQGFLIAWPIVADYTLIDDLFLGELIECAF